MSDLLLSKALQKDFITKETALLKQHYTNKIEELINNHINLIDSFKKKLSLGVIDSYIDYRQKEYYQKIQHIKEN